MFDVFTGVTKWVNDPRLYQLPLRVSHCIKKINECGGGVVSLLRLANQVILMGSALTPAEHP